MEAKAIARYVRVTPRKARIVVDLVRGKSVIQAQEILTFTNREPVEQFRTGHVPLAHGGEDLERRLVEPPDLVTRLGDLVTRLGDPTCSPAHSSCSRGRPSRRPRPRNRPHCTHAWGKKR